METTEHDSGYSWLRLGLSLAIATVGNVGMWAVIVVMPAIQAEFAIDRAAATLPYTATMLGFASGNLLIGRVVDRFGITVALWGAAISLSTGFAASSISQSVFILTILHLAVGLGSAASFGPLIADVSQWFMIRRGIAVAITASGNYISGAFWPIILAPVLATSGWRTTYVALAVIVLVVVLPLSLALRRRVTAETSFKAETAAAVRATTLPLSPRMLQFLLGLAGVACCVAMSMPQVHIVAYCVDLGFGPAVGAQMLSLMLAGGVVSRLASGMLADRIGGLPTLLLGATAQCVALFLFLPFDGLVPLYLVSLIFGLSQGGIVPGYAIVVREYLPPRIAGTAVGLVMSMTILGMALGGWMTGWIYDAAGGYGLAFLNGIGWNVLNIVILGGLFLLSKRPGRAVQA